MYKRIAIAGATGSFGAMMAEAFLKNGDFEVFFIARENPQESSKKKCHEHLLKRGVQLIPLSTEHNQMVEKLRGIDVIVSCLNGEALGTVQVDLMKAAKKAEVKLFIPSEYGVDIDRVKSNQRNPIFEQKIAMRKALREQSMGHVIILTGFMMDFVVGNPWFGYALDKGHMTVFGDIDKKCGYIHRGDIARYVVHLVSRDELVQNVMNHQILLVAEYISSKDIIQLLEKKRGKSLEIHQVSLAEVQEQCDRSGWGLDTFGMQCGYLVSNGICDDPFKNDRVLPPPEFNKMSPSFTTVAQFVESWE